jgi:hypothetical protein
MLKKLNARIPPADFRTGSWAGGDGGEGEAVVGKATGRQQAQPGRKTPGCVSPESGCAKFAGFLSRQLDTRKMCSILPHPRNIISGT